MKTETIQAGTRRLRLAIIGTGGYAHHLTERLHTLPLDAELVAATSRNPNNEAGEALKARGVRLFPNLDSLLEFASDNVDVILNPTPIPVHKETTIKCLDAGLPVWLEKPPVARLEELDELLEKSEETGLPIEVCFNSLYAFRVQELKADLVAGVFGKVEAVRSIAAWVRTADYWNRADWVGLLKKEDQWIYDGSINNPFAHVLCNSLYFAAPQQHQLANFTELEARLWRANEIETEDTSSLSLLTPEGVRVLCHLTLSPEEEITPLTVIDTTEATITLRDFSTVIVDWKDGRTELRESFKENRIEMLEMLCHNFKNKLPSFCNLALTRPFTAVVNAAFEQVLSVNDGSIPKIPDTLVDEYTSGSTKAKAIKGINARMQQAHSEKRLLNFD